MVSGTQPGSGRGLALELRWAVARITESPRTWPVIRRNARRYFLRHAVDQLTPARGPDHTEWRFIHNMARRRSDDKRSRILHAAVKVFARRGYFASRVADVARRAGVADGTIYLYFRNKEDAFCRVIETVIVDELAVSAVVPLDHAPRQSMEQGIRNFIAV